MEATSCRWCDGFGVPCGMYHPPAGPLDLRAEMLAMLEKLAGNGLTPHKTEIEQLIARVKELT